MHQPVLSAVGFSVDLQFAGVHIKQPDLCNVVAGVQRELDSAVIFERAVGNLDDQQDVSGRRVSVGIVGAFDEGNIGLRFATLVEDDGVLHPDHVAGRRAAAQTLGEAVDHECVPAA